MKNLFVLFRHELKMLFIAPSTYIAGILALIIMGLIYMLTLLTISAQEQTQEPATLFFSTFWVPVLLIVPMLTMRSLAEERRLGTLESLLTTPVNPLEIILAKFLAAYVFYLLLWLTALLYPTIAAFVLKQPEMAKHLLDLGSLTGGMAFVAVSGVLFVSVGIFSSALTRSQLVAGMLSFSVIFILIVGVAALQIVQIELGQVETVGQSIIGYLQVFDHFEDFSNGIIDTRPLFYYFSSAILVLGMAVLVMEAKV